MFETLIGVLQFFFHIDRYLSAAIQTYGVLIYLIIFLIIFLETGIVVTPFFPGDSMIFAAGAFAAIGSLNVWLIWILLCIAAVGGDTLNYWIGHYVGPKIFKHKEHWFMRKDYLKKTNQFYEEHGGKTIILARFMPVIRTFAPFVAGIGKMDYKKFFEYNALGGIGWVSLFVFAGYLFGNMPIVKENLTIFIAIIIATSVIPPIYEYIKNKINKKRKKITI